MNLHAVRTIAVADAAHLEPHRLALVMPAMDDDSITRLAASIARDGQLVPITLYEGRVLDGRHRLAALVGSDVIAQDFIGTEAEALRFVIAQNAARRHFRGPSQAAMVAARLVTTRPHVSAADGDITQAMAAEVLGVSERYVRLAMQLIAANRPAVADAVFNGTLTLTAALRQPARVVERAATQAAVPVAAQAAPLAIDALLAEDDPVGWVQRLAPAEVAQRVLRLVRFARLALETAEEEFGDEMVAQIAADGI